VPRVPPNDGPAVRARTGRGDAVPPVRAALRAEELAMLRDQLIADLNRPVIV